MLKVECEMPVRVILKWTLRLVQCLWPYDLQN